MVSLGVRLRQEVRLRGRNLQKSRGGGGADPVCTSAMVRAWHCP